MLTNASNSNPLFREALEIVLSHAGSGFQELIYSQKCKQAKTGDLGSEEVRERASLNREGESAGGKLWRSTRGRSPRLYPAHSKVSQASSSQIFHRGARKELVCLSSVMVSEAVK